MSPEERAAYAARAAKASEDARLERERQVEAGRIETAITMAIAHAMLPQIVHEFGDTPIRQKERRDALLRATYGSEAAA
jgi:hypothetical protein